MEEKKALKEKKKSTRARNEIVSKNVADGRAQKNPNAIRYRVPKSLLKDINKTETLTPEQIEKYMAMIALGIIPDRFGLEASIDVRMKALDNLASYNGMKQNKLELSGADKPILIRDNIPRC